MNIRESKFHKTLSRLKVLLVDYLNVVIIKLSTRNYIIVNCWVIQKYGKCIPNNFGDDINVPIIEALTGKKVLVHSTLHTRKVENYLCIGSVIETHCDSMSNVWGSGVLYGDAPLNEKPKRVYAVRGKLTKQFLESNGVSCPPVFGDPALLLPYIYDNPVDCKFEFGIIPHYTEIDNLKQNTSIKNNPNVLIIDLAHYVKWQDVIDEIRSCRYILSSSLHGLIISDAYKIPNLHICITNRVNGGELKFMDYCSGVNKQYIEPLDFRGGIDLDEALIKLASYKCIDYNCSQLLKNAPFEIDACFLKKITDVY